MNLEFRNVKTVNRDGQKLIWQRAVITEPKIFWPNYRRAHTGLKDHVSIRKENGSWVAYRLIPVSCPSEPVAVPYILKDRRGLLPYQPLAVAPICNSLIRHGAAIDGSDTGIGKSYVALATAREMGLRPGIICKKAGIISWKRACGAMRIKPLWIVNWESAQRGKFGFLRRRQNEYSGRWEYRWDVPRNVLLIFDEAHVANHDDSNNSALFRASLGKPSLSISATFADRPMRLRSLMHVLRVVSFDQFPRWLRDRGHFVNKYEQIEGVSERQDMLELNKMLYPKYGARLSYSHSEVKKIFPRAVYQTMPLELGAKKRREQNKLYDRLIAQVSHYKELGSQADALVADLRYRQAIELMKAPLLVEIARNYVDEGRSVVIFANFRETLTYLGRRLNTKSLIFGDQERFGIDRGKVLNDFQNNKTRAVLCMSDAGGQSLDLHDLNGGHPRISLICPTYTAVTFRQVCGRTYRAGSKTTPVMKLVYAAGTIEDKVSARVGKKLDNISTLNDGDLMEPDLFGMGVR